MEVKRNRFHVTQVNIRHGTWDWAIRVLSTSLKPSFRCLQRLISVKNGWKNAVIDIIRKYQSESKKQVTTLNFQAGIQPTRLVREKEQTHHWVVFSVKIWQNLTKSHRSHSPGYPPANSNKTHEKGYQKQHSKKVIGTCSLINPLRWFVVPH